MRRSSRRCWPFGRTRAVYRFGSTVTGHARPDSDVDVAVLVERPITGREKLELLTAIALAAHRDADVMDLARASPVAQFEVIGSACKLLDADPRKTGKFELQALKDYGAYPFPTCSTSGSGEGCEALSLHSAHPSASDLPGGWCR